MPTTIRLVPLCLLACTITAQPTIRTVCSSGCNYTSLQTAIDAAQRGWVLVLQAGANYDTTTGFTLPAKTGTGWITMRSSRLGELAPRQRVSPGDAALMPKIRVAAGGSTYLIRTTGEPSAYWRFEGLEFTVSTTGLNNTGAFLFIGRLSDNSPENRPEKISHHFEIDRCYLHGLPLDKGPRRAVIHNGNDIGITNSYISEIKADDAETHALLGTSLRGPLRVENNYVGGGAISVLLGGDPPGVAGMSPMHLRFAGNLFDKPGAHQVKRYKANPIGTTLPTTGSLTAAGPTNAQTFWRTTTQEFFVFGTSAWIKVDGVAASQTCLDGTFWRNESTVPAYWICTAGVWTTTGSDRVATGLAGPFNGWTLKNFLETKNSIGMLVEGNQFQNFTFPAAQRGAAVHANFNSTQSQLGSTTSATLVENNRMLGSGAGFVQTYQLVEGDVASISNTNPAVVTISAANSPVIPAANVAGCPFAMRFTGATGNWTVLLSQGWQASSCSGHTFTIPLDATALGPLTGAVKVSDESPSFFHKLPRQWMYRNNFVRASLGNQVDGGAGIYETLPSGSSYLFGYSIFIFYPDTVVDHNTFAQQAAGPTFSSGTLAFIGNQPVPRTSPNYQMMNIRLSNNLKEGGDYNIKGSSTSINLSPAGCNLTPEFLDIVRFPRNVVVNLSSYINGTLQLLYFQSHCRDWAWPWTRSGGSMRGTVTAASVTGGLLTLTFSTGHGLLQNTRFRIAASTPAGLAGVYIVPTNNLAGGQTGQNDLQIRVPTTAGAGSYTGVTAQADAGIADAGTLNYRLSATSMYKNYALDGSDPGADLNMVDWATETVTAGIENPYLGFVVKDLRARATGADLVWTAYSTAACTWQVSPTRAFAASVGSVSQIREGRSGRATFNGLTSSSSYWYRVTCDGGRYREGEFSTLP